MALMNSVEFNLLPAKEAAIGLHTIPWGARSSGKSGESIIILGTGTAAAAPL